ncbi:hypothetical protein BN193_10995 [Lactococcus raffinolactis 4877]|nr:hypothetical protein BN193_10995 [Lactococcus raffinolactis 4877]
MERYKLLEGIVIAMIMAGSDYDPIKQAIKIRLQQKSRNCSPTKRLLTE